MEWCLPNFLLVPEICGGPLFMIFLGAEIWFFILFLHIAVPGAVISALMDKGQERGGPPSDTK